MASFALESTLQDIRSAARRTRNLAESSSSAVLGSFRLRYVKLIARTFSRPKRIVIFSFALLLVLVLPFCWHVLNQAGAAIAEGARRAASTHHAAVSVFTVRTVVSRFEPVLKTSEFESAAAFAGDLYVCSSSALFRYSAGGLAQTWRTGTELPPTRLLSVAVRTGIGNPELWIATAGAGILIYDGLTFRQLLPQGPALRKISALLPLSNGQVLAGTPESGLYLSDGKSLRVFHPEFLKTAVTALAGDENHFWIGTRADGAWLWQGGEAHHFAADLPDPQVLSIAAKGDDAWVGTPLGVCEFKNGKLTRHLAEGIFARALAAHDGELWIGTLDQGAFAIPLTIQKPRPQLTSNSGNADSIASFAVIGAVLTAIEPHAVVDVSAGQPLVTMAANALASSHITALHADFRGRLWIGYFDRGIDSILETNSGDSGTPLHFEDDTLFCINRIKENPRDGSILVATANGLAVFDVSGRLRQVLTRDSGLISSNVTDILFTEGASAEPVLAIATPAGISFVERGSISSIYAFHGLVNNHVFTLANLNGTLQAGTLGGVSVLRRGLVQASFNTANSTLRQNWITASAVFGGHLYLGTYGSGVIRFDSDGVVESFAAFTGRRFEINLNALLATDHALYAGTAGEGLATLRANDTRWRFISQGLPSLNVTALDARNGRLYIGTDNGLVRIQENNLLP